MHINYYKFKECGTLNKILIILCALSAILSLIFAFLGGATPLFDDHYYVHPYSVWFLFFLALSIFSFIANLCVTKICKDIANILKSIEESKNK